MCPEKEEMLTEKVRQRTFLYDTKSPDYRDQHIRAKAWEGIGKELKIKRKFYVSLRDLGIVCPRLKYYGFRVCVCSLSYAACIAHAPYYIVLCVLSDHTTFFPHYLINGTI